jgi:hypothetical protein
MEIMRDPQRSTAIPVSRRSTGLIAGALLLMILALPRVGAATPILSEVANCGLVNCFGTTLGLIIDDGGTADNIYTAILNVDTSGYSGSQDFISAVDFKVGSSVDSAQLTSAPIVGGTLNSWTTVWNTGQAGSACAGSGTGFVTSCDSAPVTLAPIGGLLTWTWTFTTTSLVDFGHIGVKFNNAAGTTPGQLISVGATQVPEPSSFALFALGTAALAFGSRRRGRLSTKG